MDLVDFLHNLGLDFAGKEHLIGDVLGSDELDEIVDLAIERTDFGDLEEAGFSPALVDKIFQAFRQEKERRALRNGLSHGQPSLEDVNSAEVAKPTQLKRASTWEYKASERMTTILEALSVVDDETAIFCVEALANADSSEWQAVLEPFLDPAPVLAILQNEDMCSQTFLAQVLEVLSGGNLEVDSSSFFGRRKSCIENAHNRAISLPQLQILLCFIMDQANADGMLPWRDRDPRSLTYETTLNISTINLYHVVDLIVKPATIEERCSFVEILADGPQRPRFFVSHAWIEPVQKFACAVKKHAEIRGATGDDHWWVCAYANNQHELQKDIDPDPKKTSFYLAMQQCEAVLLVLDEHATPFTRIWCCFEEAMVLEGDNKLLLDVATVANGIGEVLTEGLVEADFHHGEQYALENKRTREAGFPLALIEHAYEIDITRAAASVEADRNRILNAIAGVAKRKLSAAPDLTNPIFHRVNCSLRGIFAEAAAQKAADAGLFEQVMTILQEDATRARLTLNFGGCTNFIDLTALSAVSKLKCLRELTVNFDYCKQLIDLSPLSNGLRDCNSLLKLTLSFKWCTSLSEVSALMETLQSLHKVEHLVLVFDHCSQLARGLGALGSVLSGVVGLQELRNLQLSFLGCTALLSEECATLSVLGGLSRLLSLQHLRLNFQCCKQLLSLRGLEGLSDLGNLESFTASFAMCAKLTDASALLELNRMSRIKDVNVNLCECTKLPNDLQCHFHNVAQLAAAFGRLGQVYREGQAVEFFFTREGWQKGVVRSVHMNGDIVVSPTGKKQLRRLASTEVVSKLRPV